MSSIPTPSRIAQVRPGLNKCSTSETSAAGQIISSQVTTCAKPMSREGGEERGNCS